MSDLIYVVVLIGGILGLFLILMFTSFLHETFIYNKHIYSYKGYNINPHIYNAKTIFTISNGKGGVLGKENGEYYFKHYWLDVACKFNTINEAVEFINNLKE